MHDDVPKKRWGLAQPCFFVWRSYEKGCPSFPSVLPAPTKRRMTMKYICLGYLEPEHSKG
jgi:hypothetical protein